MKKLTSIAAGIVLATGLAGGLAACGTAAPSAPAAVATVTVAPTPTVTKTVAAIPTPTRTVYLAPAAQAAPALTNCGEGVYGEDVFAGADTSCPFALNVEQAWSVSGATDTISAYSPVTGLSYVMNCGGNDGTVNCTGGDNALVEFSG